MVDPLTSLLLPDVAIPSDPADLPALLPRLLERFSLIPYENLTKVLSVHEKQSRIVKHSPEDVVLGFLSHGTGGTCFPLTATLVRLVRSLGLEAHPILADRRYGSDTHCAVIVKLTPTEWSLIDPGYLIHQPVPLPATGSHFVETPFNHLELRVTSSPDRIELLTLNETSSRSRLTYKITPVDEAHFQRAWDASFSWEMMTYPIVSGVRGSEQIYLQKSALLRRSSTGSERQEMDTARLACEISQRLGIDLSLVQRALTLLSRTS